MSFSEDHGKDHPRRQVTYRIGPIAEDRLRQAATLFNMKPSEYAKAILYRDLGVFNEPLDQRRRPWRQKKRQQHEIEDSEAETFEFENAEPEDDDVEEFRAGRASTVSR